MITLEKLCNGINMPEEVTVQVLSFYQKYDFTKIQASLNKLQAPASWEEGLKELKQIFPEDRQGIALLTAMLTEGIITYEKYQNKGISDTIFYDTFGCFSRFVKEHMVSYGCYGFDREFWTTRQLSMLLFRIGELEYEMTEHDGQKVISLHIPSDVKLTKENCRRSYEQAKAFLAEYYPDFTYERFVCHSWLLSPNLKEVLAADSHILQFQNEFTVESFEPEAMDYMEWVFKNRDLTSIEEVPQDTSLQRKVKAYIKNGGFIGCAFGGLKEDAFQ